MDAHPLWHCQIELLDSEPLIWRRFQVPSDKTLGDLHTLLQLIMGWQNRHSYYFEIDRPGAAAKHCYGSAALPDIQDPALIALADLNLGKGDYLLYVYDPHDGWFHRLTLNEVITLEQPDPPIQCLGGALACPPEGSGGVWGYEGLVDQLDDPDEALLDAVGLDFDPGYFKVAEVNQRLQAALVAPMALSADQCEP